MLGLLWWTSSRRVSPLWRVTETLRLGLQSARCTDRPGKDDDDTKSQMSFSLSDNTSLSCEQTPSSIKHQRVTTPTWKGGNQKQGFPFHLCMWYGSQLSFLLSLVLCSRHNKSNHGSGRDNSDIIPLVGCLVQREPSTACSALWWTGKIVEGPSLDIDLSFSPPPWRPPLQLGRISGLVRPKISHRTCGTFCPTHPIAPCQPSCSARPGQILCTVSTAHG